MKIFSIILAILCARCLAGDTETVAATLCGEARGEGELGMRAVMEVIHRRAVDRHLTPARVCLQPKQFSCWNGGAIARWRLMRRMRACAEYPMAIKIARERPSKLTRRATHYCTIETHPAWARGRAPVAVIGNHKFYRIES